MLTGAGFQPDWPGQMIAQLVGVIVLLVLSLGVCWAFFRGVEGLARRARVVTEEVESGPGLPVEEGQRVADEAL